MAKRQVAIQDSIDTEEDFENYLNDHFEQLICMEIYAEFCGPSGACQNAVRKGKLEIGGDAITMVRACSDHIPQLARFRYKSEPCFLFIYKRHYTNIYYGANGIKLLATIEEELAKKKGEEEGTMEPVKYDMDEMLPAEKAKQKIEAKLEQEARDQTERLRVLTLAARKKRVCNRMVYDLRRLNFILFWPHCHKAHYDLYEKWDNIGVNVAAKEIIQLTEDNWREALYMSDVDPNEACIHALLNGPVLVVLFKLFDSDDRDFVQLMRYALYEEIPVPKEDTPPDKQKRPVPAFEQYATISKTARKIRRERYNAMLQKLKEEEEERERLRLEQERMAREAEEERIRLEKEQKEQERMARLAAGLPADPEPEPEPEAQEAVAEEQKEKRESDIDMDMEGLEEEILPEAEPATVAPVAEEAVVEEVKEEEVVEEFHSWVSVEGEEYIPPGGLFVPGLYSPPNELAKTNGLAFFFPRNVSKMTTIESEHLPPHVLVMFEVTKRNEVMDLLETFKNEVLHYGIFVGDEPTNAEFVAYTMKQYDKMVRLRRHLDRIAVSVSRKRSLPLLHMVGLNPCYISSDVDAGEKDCLALFPVGYGDEYVEVESVHEISAPSLVKEIQSERIIEQEEEEEEEEETGKL